jgi:hypothetical protein
MRSMTFIVECGICQQPWEVPQPLVSMPPYRGPARSESRRVVTVLNGAHHSAAWLRPERRDVPPLPIEYGL